MLLVTSEPRITVVRSEDTGVFAPKITAFNEPSVPRTLNHSLSEYSSLSPESTVAFARIYSVPFASSFMVMVAETVSLL